MAANSYRSVNCGLINIQSVSNKTLEIRDYISENNLDILLVTETWLHEHDYAKIKEMTPDTHVFLHVSRKNRRGGGVGVFIANTLTNIRKESVPITSNFEVIHVSCTLGGSKLVFITVYRPPDTSVNAFLDEFRLYLESVNTVGSCVFVCGDFNFWVDDLRNVDARGFIEMMDLLGYLNCIDKVTSRTGHMLDLVFYESQGDPVHSVVVDDICTLSPVHMAIKFSLNMVINSKYSKKIVFRNKRNLNRVDFIRRLADEMASKGSENCEHGFVMKNRCLRCYVLLYRNAAKQMYEIDCPLIEKVIVMKDNAPWYDNEIAIAKRDKRRKERRWRTLKTIASKSEYLLAKNALNSLMRRKRRAYYMRKTDQFRHNISKLYEVTDNLLGNKGKLNLPDGFSDVDLANRFADFFIMKIETVIGNLALGTYCNLFPVVAGHNKLHCFNEVSLGDIRAIVGKVKPTFCCGDPFPFADVRDSDNVDDLLNVYLNIVNLSISTSQFPCDEKHAFLKPVLKGGMDSQSLNSYRPVSNLSFVSKILENVILEQLMVFLQRTGVFPDNQSAYRKLYSTETALCAVVNDLLVMMDDGKCGILILLDLSAAFDTVVHSLLLNDLRAVGIEGGALQYLGDYLEGRTYSVQIGQSFSRTVVLERGVPQGSVLGPILFCIYTIELSHLLERHGVCFKLFADDTQFYFSIDNIVDSESKISEIMTDVKKWMDHKQLKLNDSKTECLIVGKERDLRRLDLRTLKVLGNEFEVSRPIKNLGVIFDQNLSFSDHVNRITRVASYHLRNIAFLKKYLGKKTITMLIHNYVISRLDYCNVLLYGVPNYNLKKIQSVLNRAARLILGLSPRERITPALIELHWLPIKARVIFKMCTLAYQALMFDKPRYLRNKLMDFRPGTVVHLRHSDEIFRLEEPRSNLNVGCRAFCRSAPRLFNRLPLLVRQSPNCVIFKKRLKTHLFTECYDIPSQEITQEFAL